MGHKDLLCDPLLYRFFALLLSATRVASASASGFVQTAQRRATGSTPGLSAIRVISRASERFMKLHKLFPDEREPSLGSVPESRVYRFASS
jgi:hypothetical protein